MEEQFTYEQIKQIHRLFHDKANTIRHEIASRASEKQMSQTWLDSKAQQLRKVQIIEDRCRYLINRQVAEDKRGAAPADSAG